MTHSSPWTPFSGVFARGPVADLVSPRGWVSAMLEVEVALAKAAATCGLVSSDAAQSVANAATVDAELMAGLQDADAETGNPVVALVSLLKSRVPQSANSAVHVGATSQDIIDTAMMLMMRKSVPLIVQDAHAACDACARLTSAHRKDVMLGRTLMQPAVPITFGFKAAGWLLALEESSERLMEAAQRNALLQFGGAAGTLASLGDKAPALSQALARELSLRLPAMPWHTRRLVLHEPAMMLAGLCGVAEKIAQDIVLLAQPEVGEVTVLQAKGGGASSAMPHKQNPVAAIAVLACTRRTPPLLSTLLSCAAQEHERAAGAWHAEWETIADILRLAGSAASWLAELVSHLQTHPQAMLNNYEATLGLPLAEQMRSMLESNVGRHHADTLVREAMDVARTQRKSLTHAIFLEPVSSQLHALNVDAVALSASLTPESYLGQTQSFIDNALAAYHARAKGNV